MEITIGKWEFENNVDCKCIPDGWEIFPDTVNRLGIDPADFGDSAYWQDDSIIVSDRCR